MRQKILPQDLTTQEYRKFVLITALAGLLVLFALLVNILIDTDIQVRRVDPLTVVIAGAAIYIAIYSRYVVTVTRNRNILDWANAIISGAGLFILAISIPDEFLIYYNLLMLVAAVSLSILSGRFPTLIMILIGSLPLVPIRLAAADSFRQWAEYTSIPVTALIISETLARIQNIAREQVHRLETINAFSRQVTSTLDQAEILLLLSSAIPKAVAADSYYLGILEGDEIAIPIFYDDGEYFNGIRVKAKGTLSGWVVEHQKELFLPDLRQPLGLEGIEVVVIGQERASLSWIGVPLTSNKFKGLLSLASYQPNAFNRGNVELLANLSQHAALAMENAASHAEVKERTRLDSMTGVLNHGFFLKTLQDDAAESNAFGAPLSIIMLDVDYFKQYNDTYGHLAGDAILNLLCETMRAHIKTTDAIGRWGGEEFIIALPNADGVDAHHVADRIRQTMRDLKIPGRDGEEIPAPTVSQGIAVFPAERNEIYKLIDLADQRLYVAKERGRDQIEPNIQYWKSKTPG
jgi:diguanylate cyclase (GGDEF)-like protein